MTWFLVRTKPNREHYAAGHVKRQGCEIFLPEFYDTIRRKIAILFPSYLFVLTHGGQWSFLLSTYGVAGIIKTGDEACPVPNVVVEKLKRSRNKQGLIVLPARRRFHFNQRVRIISGSLTDYIGLYQGTNSEYRVRVLLEFMGRLTPVWLDERQLSAA